LGITHKREYNSEHGRSLGKRITWPYCLDMLIVRINATGDRGLDLASWLFRNKYLLYCYTMAKSRKYVVLLAKDLHHWRESLWLNVFVIGINAVWPCLYSDIHVTTKEVHGIESLYMNSIRYQL
jgi:hypothetical protein